MSIRPALMTGGSLALGMLALGAVQSGLPLAMTPGRGSAGNLTAVMGVLKGTFSKPMPDGKGGTIAPTGKAFAVDMVTVGIWNRQGTMDEEFLFWDNQTFYGEMGLG